jgi:hypothetical protein
MDENQYTIMYRKITKKMFQKPQLFLMFYKNITPDNEARVAQSV